MDIFQWWQEDRIIELSQCGPRKTFSVFRPWKGYSPFLPKYLGKKEGFFFFFQNVLLKSKHTLVALLSLRENEGRYERACPATSRYGSIISVLPRGLSFGFAFIFSPDPENGVPMLCWTGWVLFGWSRPWRVWYTVVCWKVLAHKDERLY